MTLRPAAAPHQIDPHLHDHLRDGALDQQGGVGLHVPDVHAPCAGAATAKNRVSAMEASDSPSRPSPPCCHSRLAFKRGTARRRTSVDQHRHRHRRQVVGDHAHLKPRRIV